MLLTLGQVPSSLDWLWQPDSVGWVIEFEPWVSCQEKLAPGRSKEGVQRIGVACSLGAFGTGPVCC